MKRIMKHGKTLGLVLALFAVLTAVLPAQADNNNPSDHPIKILKARYQNDRSRATTSARGNLTIWMQNAADVTVDGVEVEVELYNDRDRKVETLRKKVDTLNAGEKKVITFRWDVVAESSVKPRFYVEYNSRGTQKTRFEGDTPNWN